MSDYFQTTDWTVFGEHKLGPIFRRPLSALSSKHIKQIYAWFLENRDDDGIIDRTRIQPTELGRLINYTSLIDLIKEGDDITDFYVRVMSRAAADIFGERSRVRGSELQSPDMRDRMLKLYCQCYSERAPVLTQAKLLLHGSTRRCAETLCLPVKKDGVCDQVMVLNEYFITDWDEFDAAMTDDRNLL